MSDPRFHPRGFSADPKGFGRDHEMDWTEQDTLDGRVYLKAAKLQHLYAIRIRTRIRETGSSLKAYAAASDTKYDRLLKVLRGDTILRLEDLAVADVILGLVSEFALLEAAATAKALAEQHEADRAREEERRVQHRLERAAYAAAVNRHVADEFGLPVLAQHPDV